MYWFNKMSGHLNNNLADTIISNSLNTRLWRSAMFLMYFFLSELSTLHVYHNTFTLNSLKFFFTLFWRCEAYRVLKLYVLSWLCVQMLMLGLMCLIWCHLDSRLLEIKDTAWCYFVCFGYSKFGNVCCFVVPSPPFPWMLG